MKKILNIMLFSFVSLAIMASPIEAAFSMKSLTSNTKKSANTSFWSSYKKSTIDSSDNSSSKKSFSSSFLSIFKNSKKSGTVNTKMKGGSVSSSKWAIPKNSNPLSNVKGNSNGVSSENLYIDESSSEYIRSDFLSGTDPENIYYPGERNANRILNCKSLDVSIGSNKIVIVDSDYDGGSQGDILATVSARYNNISDTCTVFISSYSGNISYDNTTEEKTGEKDYTITLYYDNNPIINITSVVYASGNTYIGIQDTFNVEDAEAISGNIGMMEVELKP